MEGSHPWRRKADWIGIELRSANTRFTSSQTTTPHLRGANKYLNIPILFYFLKHLPAHHRTSIKGKLVQGNFLLDMLVLHVHNALSLFILGNV